jgi:hypothetical protein
MNVNTNEIYRDLGLVNEDHDHVHPIPDDLQKEAKKVLGNNESVKLPMNSKSKLARWAEKVRINQEGGVLKTNTLNLGHGRIL